MSRVGNIFELLSDENDEGGVRQPVVQKEAPKQEQKPKAPQQKGQQQKNDRQADNKGRDNRQRTNERRQPPREQGAGAAAGEVDRAANKNRPQRQPREGAERRTKNLERAEGTEGEQRKRLFDRRSGTGRGPRDNVKREGRGKANWGTVEDDKKGQTEQVEQEPAQENKEQGTEMKEGEVKPAETEEPKEEEDNTKTLEEYRKSLKTPTIALPAPRQVQATGKEWANFVPLNREPENGTQQAKDKKKTEQEEKEAAEKKISADQIINFAEPSKPSFRGGRGGKRETGGRREGGAGRGKKTKAPAPNFKDEKSFPSLGGASK